jgi:CelD/BcsL family acetyltransferase involved in cellulose biosynthesis
MWMLNWWRTFGMTGGRQLRIACFFQGVHLVGLAPFLCRRYWYRPGIPFRRLEPLGTGENPADAIHPDYLGVLAAVGAEADVASALATALVSGILGGWDELVLPMMNGEDPLLTPLTHACGAVGLTAHTEVTGAASYIPLPNSWEAYLESLSSSRRSFLRQSLRRFDKWAGSESCLHSVNGPADLEEGKRILAALHQERWGADGKFGSPGFDRFHDALLPALLDAGALELLWLSVRGEPVAAQYNILWAGKVYFYQSGRKKDVPAAQRPGIVLHAHALQRAIAAGRREYDFLSGGEHYKRQLALASRPIVALRIHRCNLVEQLRRCAEGGITLARRLRDGARGARRWLSRAPEAPPPAADNDATDSPSGETA